MINILLINLTNIIMFTLSFSISIYYSIIANIIITHKQANRLSIATPSFCLKHNSLK